MTTPTAPTWEEAYGRPTCDAELIMPTIGALLTHTTLIRCTLEPDHAEPEHCVSGYGSDLLTGEPVRVSVRWRA